MRTRKDMLVLTVKAEPSFNGSPEAISPEKQLIDGHCVSQVKTLLKE
jgi:hypothetical protein